MDQVNPNALGAPAEGFGQTVSFAFDPRGQAPNLQLESSRPSGAGVSGVSRPNLASTNVTAQAPRPDPAIALLMQVGDAILAPHLERERTAKYVAGMQAAMGGAAVKDIVEQQPWYSQLFGDTPMVEGARAYSAGAAVNRTVAEQSSNMDKLKTLNSEQAAKHFSDTISASMVGDPSTDALIMKGMVESLPTLMKTQAKVHYGYGQQQATLAMGANMTTASESLQSMGRDYAKGVISDADFEVAQKNFIYAIAPPEGINEENYAKTTLNSMKQAAITGQFHAVDAFKRSGGMSILTVEQQNSLEATLLSSSTKHRNEYAVEFSREMSELKHDAGMLAEGMSTADIHARYVAMNDTYRKLSGSPVGLWSSDEIVAGTTRSLDFFAAEKAAAAKHNAVITDRNAAASTKAAAAAALDMQVDRAVASGEIASALVLPGVSKDTVDLKFKHAFDSAESKSQSGGAFIMEQGYAKSQYVNGLVANDLQLPLVMAEGKSAPTSGFLKSIDVYQRMQQTNPAMADAYFGKYAPTIERYIRMTAGDPSGGNMAEAFSAAMDRTKANRPEALPHKEVASLVDKVHATEGWSWPGWLGGSTVKMRQETVERIAGYAKENIEDWRGVPGITDERAVKMGITSAINSGRVELLGGFTIVNEQANGGKVAPALRQLGSASANIPAGQEDAYFKGFLKDELKFQEGSTNIVRSGTNAAGVATFAATVVGSDGTAKMHIFNSNQWRDYSAKRTLTNTVNPERSPWSFGPEITYGTSSEEGRQQVYNERAARAKAQAEANKRANRP
jgi:hypothetical protein